MLIKFLLENFSTNILNLPNKCMTFWASPVLIGLYKHFPVGLSRSAFSFARDVIISFNSFLLGIKPDEIESKFKALPFEKVEKHLK